MRLDCESGAAFYDFMEAATYRDISKKFTDKAYH